MWLQFCAEIIFENSYMYTNNLCVLPIVLEDEYIGQLDKVCMLITISSYVNHIFLSPAHVGLWNMCENMEW
jgi:hypothetical protein